jgi:hypothetical protein
LQVPTQVPLVHCEARSHVAPLACGATHTVPLHQKPVAQAASPSALSTPQVELQDVWPVPQARLLGQVDVTSPPRQFPVPSQVE